MRIATWNVDHGARRTRPVELQKARLEAIGPDLLVLTETTPELDLSSLGYASVLPKRKNGYGRYWTTIWSRMTIARVWETYDPQTAVCAEIAAAGGSFLLYGTILTWHADPGPDPGHKSPQWLEHHRAIFDHGDDWDRVLRETKGELPLVVAGDFNQTRDGSHAYCSKGGQSILMLDEQLKRNRLACLTEAEFPLAIDPRSGRRRHNIDHICATRGAFDLIGTGAWDHFTADGTYLSDHNGVYADLQRVSG